MSLTHTLRPDLDPHLTLGCVRQPEDLGRPHTLRMTTGSPTLAGASTPLEGEGRDGGPTQSESGPGGRVTGV